MIAVLTLATAAADVADLSAPLERSADYNSNPVQIALRASQDYGSPLLAYTVLKGGKIVADAPGGGSSSIRTEYLMWSVTKSVSSILIGQLVDAGSVATSDTLEQIFAEEVAAGITTCRSRIETARRDSKCSLPMYGIDAS